MGGATIRREERRGGDPGRGQTGRWRTRWRGAVTAGSKLRIPNPSRIRAAGLGPQSGGLPGPGRAQLPAPGRGRPSSGREYWTPWQ